MKKIIKTLSMMLIFIIIFSCSGVTAQAASVSDMKSKVLSVAQNEVGYEGSSSYSKYGEWYGYQGAWCTTFVLWCFNKAGNSLGVSMYGKIVPSGGNCNSMISWFTNKGRYHKASSGYTPQKGDLIFFNWSGSGSAQHVGIVKSISGSTVYTIEGNCSGKVKERKYTTSGSKPYNNISAILGYASPAWSSVSSSSGKSNKTTKKQTTTAKKTTSAAKSKKKKASTTKKSRTSSKTTTTASSSAKSTTASTAKSTTQVKAAQDMDIYAPSTDLQIGDSVKLDYTLKPSGVNAVVEYFCDEENIIDLSADGTVTATGEGTATVVVCANDEIYKQCDFTVTQVSSSVTKKSSDSMSVIETNYSASTSSSSGKSAYEKLSEMGVNFQQLNAHKKYYIYPVAIIGVTAMLCLCIAAVKKISRAMRKRKEKKAARPTDTDGE